MTTSGASTPSVVQPTGGTVLLGRPCDNTFAALTVLEDAGVELTAVILADPGPAAVQDPVEQDGDPVYRAPSPRATRRLLEHLRPDLVIAACYPWRLSRRSREVARCGALNIHPSPLPFGRGPDPVFWVYRHGLHYTGVTVHQMNDGIDAGPILARQDMAVPNEMDAATLERLLFETGASMLADLLPQVLAGRATTTPQDERAATYQPAPSAHDWVISPLLPAAWAWRFARGVEPLHGPLAVHTRGQLVPVRRAISWGNHGDPPAELPAGAFAVRFRPGWIVFA